MSAIRVVDIGKIGLGSAEPSDDDLLAAGREIANSFRDTGFAYLSNHGISQQLQDETFGVAKRFFDLSDDEKLVHERFVRKGYNGYTPIGGENTTYAGDKRDDLIDFKECYDFMHSDDHSDSAVPEFGVQLEEMGAACCRLSGRLLAALDAALGCDQLLTRCHQRQLQPGGCTVLRVLHYPPLPSELTANPLRCGAHTDYGTFTLLFQHGVGGLEVETSDCVWVSAEPIQDTILVNIGDMMEAWTAGQLRATNHRVVAPAGALERTRSRQSMVFFVHPDDGTIVAPLNDDPRYQPVDSGKFLRKQYAATYPKFSDCPMK